MIATGLIETARTNANGQLTLEIIRDCVNQAAALLSGVSGEIDTDYLVAEFTRDYHTYVGRARTLMSDEDGWKPWLDKNKSDIEWRFWERYRTYLLQSQNLPKVVVDALDEVTDETLGNFINPVTKGPWDRRGMVVGHVQAGKTTNYAGLICKAADAGYKVIIVLTGFHNNLRTQTQIRLEEAFVGYDITASRDEGARMPVGVGLVSSDPHLRVDTITNRSETGDFKREVANNFGINPGGRPLFFVIKKNASVLRNLVKYLEAVHNEQDSERNYKLVDVPLLLIDDEADQGSVDTKKMDFDASGDPDQEHDPTTLNRLIRTILHIFNQSSYVGYTATPFANIFIHDEAKTSKLGEDLFPRSFITVMPTPSNYVGPETVFGLGEDDQNRGQGLPIVHQISDYAASDRIREEIGWMPPKHDRMHIPLYEGKDCVPPSLRKALQVFIIGCAVRVLRGQGNKHTSMLVHVTRFVDVQNRVYQQVSNLIRDIKQVLRYGEEGSSDDLLDEMHDIWKEEFIPVNREIDEAQCPEHAWADVCLHLPAAAQSINVRQINGTAGDVLDYVQHKSTGLNVIAIGGDKLSRGLTLEGLTVSYFTRPSRMYDTLMQMGRWFGYRDGFIDICRLYAPSMLIEWFEHITDASDELRRDFIQMCDMGETPATFGQRVRSHPVLTVTSVVKMRHSAELTLSYQGAISETIVYSREKSDVDKNYAVSKKLLEKLDTYAHKRFSPIRSNTDKDSPGKCFWSRVNSEDVLDFLTDYTTPNHVRRVNTTLLAQYIKNQVADGNLKNWSVLLAGKDPQGSDNRTIASCLTGLIMRAVHRLRSEEGKDADVYRIRRLVSPQDESWDLTEEQYHKAYEMTEDDKVNRPGGEQIRACRSKNQAILIIYPLLAQEDAEPREPTNSPYIGFAVSFPGIKNDKPVKYRVNQVYQGQLDD